jgi:hypothetical protein
MPTDLFPDYSPLDGFLADLADRPFRLAPSD